MCQPPSLAPLSAQPSPALHGHTAGWHTGSGAQHRGGSCAALGPLGGPLGLSAPPPPPPGAPRIQKAVRQSGQGTALASRGFLTELSLRCEFGCLHRVEGLHHLLRAAMQEARKAELCQTEEVSRVAVRLSQRRAVLMSPGKHGPRKEPLPPPPHPIQSVSEHRPGAGLGLTRHLLGESQSLAARDPHSNPQCQGGLLAAPRAVASGPLWARPQLFILHQPFS